MHVLHSKRQKCGQEVISKFARSENKQADDTTVDKLRYTIILCLHLAAYVCTTYPLAFLKHPQTARTPTYTHTESRFNRSIVFYRVEFCVLHIDKHRICNS